MGLFCRKTADAPAPAVIRSGLAVPDGNDSLSLTVVNSVDLSRAEVRPEAAFH
jgi:hypothetical protein